jgi:hypothetical protein
MDQDPGNEVGASELVLELPSELSDPLGPYQDPKISQDSHFFLRKNFKICFPRRGLVMTRQIKLINLELIAIEDNFFRRYFLYILTP